MTTARALLADARLQLAQAQARTESLGRRREPGRLLHRAPRIERVGEAWRLGALLLPVGDAEAVLAVGEVVRAAPEVRRGYSAESARARAAERAAAVRGGFRPGEVVHVDWQPIDLDAVASGEASGPLLPNGDQPLIRWSAAADPAPLAGYLRERVELLVHPPAGA